MKGHFESHVFKTLFTLYVTLIVIALSSKIYTVLRIKFKKIFLLNHTYFQMPFL